MHLIVSRKLSTVHGNTPAISRESIQQAVNGSGSQTHIALSEQERDSHIERQTRMGFTCHVFDYSNSFQSVTTIQSVKAA